MNKLLITAPLVLALTAGLGMSCKKSEEEKAATGGDKAGDKATKPAAKVIKIDGSSTVFPISQAVAEEFEDAGNGKVTIGVSGTGGGMKKFCRGETSITGASRPIKSSEVEKCKAAGIEFIELPVAYDGLAVVTHKNNSWAKTLTVADLKKIWAPDAQGKVMNWKDVKDGMPDKKLQLFGPGVDSGTYDYFTKAIVGKEHSSRGDFTSSEDDNVLVQGVSTDEGGLGFFGYAYYAENKDKLTLVGIDDGKADNGDGAIQPTPETVANGTYQPLSRPVFIYVNKKDSDARPEVKAFVNFYFANAKKLVPEVGYISLPDTAIALASKRFTSGTTGSVFSGGSKVGVTVEKLLSAETGGDAAKTAPAPAATKPTEPSK